MPGFKFNLKPSQFLFGAGTDQILEYSTDLLARNQTVTGWPSFSKYEAVTRIMDGTIVKVL